MTNPASVTSLWASITSWFTPTTLFLLVNLVIGTIAVTSRFNSNRRPRRQQDQLGQHGSHGQLARAPSLLDRVKSIEFSLYRFPNQEQEQEEQSNFFQHYAEHEYDINPVQAHQPQLGRAPLLDRVKSINLSPYKFPNQTQEQEQEQEQHFFHRNTELTYETNPVETEKPQLTRAPSFLERIKSINLSSVYRSRQTYHETERELINMAERETSPDHKPRKSKSKTKKVKPRVQESMKKSVSEKSMMVEKKEEEEEEEEEEAIERRRPQTARLERTVTIDDGDHGIDVKAHDFINKFKRDLRLQRLDSLLRKQEMPQGR